MKIIDFISEMGTDMANNYIKTLNKEESPDKLEEMTKLLSNMTEMAIHILRESPEFRRQFAKIHKEFLKYPECQQVIEGAMDSVATYKPELLRQQ